MHGLDVVFFVVNGGEFLAAAFVIAGNLLARIVFLLGIVALPRNPTHFPSVRVGGERRGRIARGWTCGERDGEVSAIVILIVDIVIIIAIVIIVAIIIIAILLLFLPALSTGFLLSTI